VRIGIDYTAAVRQQGGIGRYARSLIRALSLLDTKNQYVLFVAGRQGDDGLGDWPENFRLRPLPLSDRWLNILWQRLRVPLPIQLWTGRLDLFHSPDFVLPPLGRTPAVLTVHDLSFMRVPWCFVPGFRDYLEEAVTHSVERASLILADSASTERDLIELLGAQGERVQVLYPGVESRFRPVSDEATLAAVRQRYGLPDSFVLGLGTLQPRKNFAGLVDAFGRMLAAGGDVAALEDIHLVIAGGTGWMSGDIDLAVERAGLQKRVRILGFVDDRDLPALYTLARAFAFPSWYEGFGVPVLEAMACGTPVVAADNSSLPEVVGGAAIMTDAGDPDALALAMYRALAEPGLRELLIAAGFEQAARFTWQGAASELLQVYERVGRLAGQVRGMAGSSTDAQRGT
jgi:glycosyltransferase involved in cell wall biosynthesis